MPQGTLDVHVEGAVQIKDTPISGKGSPYCTLTVGTQVFSTPPVEGAGTHPYFNTEFEFQLDRTTNQLMVQIYRMKTSTDDDLLGYCTIFFKDAFYHSHVVPVKSYALTQPSGQPGGHIRLSLTFKAQPRPTAHQDRGYHYKIHEVVSASSSGHGGMEEYAVPTKKVQSKDLKSGRLIGKGPSSIVYETTFEGQRYARKDFLRVPSDIFEKEAAALVDLDHPNVLRTYCWTVDEGSCSLLLELMDDDLLNMMETRKDSQRKKFHGKSGSASQTSHLIDLHKFVEDGKNAAIRTASESVAMPPVYPFNMQEAMQIMLQIAEGMKFLHDKGVVHGDLKPKNILVTPSGRAASSSLDQNMLFKIKVADFGLVGTKMKSRSLVSRQARKLEMARWRAPELLDLNYLGEDEHKSSTDLDWDSDSSDGIIGVHVQNFTFMDMARADVYNFGLTCSQILHGGDPRSGLGVNDFVNEITLLGVRPGLPPACPGQLNDLIQLCWGNKTERPNFQNILSELKDLQASFTWTGSPVDIKNDTNTGTSSERIHTSKLELVSEYDAVSGQFSGTIPSTSLNSLVGLELDQKVGVPIGREKYLIEDIQDKSKGTLQKLKHQRRGRKSSSCLGILVCIPPKARSSFRRMSDRGDEQNKKKDGLSTPTERSSRLKRRPESAAWGKAEDGQAPQLKGAHWFSFDDIKRMTNNFNDNNVLGAGGYGKVYKGIQAGTGATVAVKRAQEGSKQGAQEFKNEIELLSRVHHNNLVGLIGFCFEKAEQMLVYEYMPNGTLTDWLRGHMSEPPLDWDRRLLIALGAARGLAYLHDNADPPIIHRDVKSCNILLDKKLNAKVADFGLSLLVPDAKDGSLKPTIKGTMGYLDPEYYMTSVLSTKSDVYSFGVVLLELLTGRPPVSHGGHIVREVRSRFDRAGMDGVKELLDPALAATREDELETFLNIALVCVEDSGLERPSMHEVVKQLEVLVGPKAQLMPGNGQGNVQSIETRMSKRERRMPLQMPSLVSDDFEPASGQFSSQFSQGSSASQQSSFKYSGGFAPLPVQPK